MKILYIADQYAFKNSGVIKKINQTVAAWRLLGHEARSFLISPPPERGDSDAQVDSQVFTSGLFNCIPRTFRYRLKYFNKILVVNSLCHAIRDYSPDVIYFRQTVWFPGLVRLLQSTQCPYVAEINTLDVNEYKLRGGVEGFLHLTTRDWLLQEASGFVAVSNEIGDAMKKFRRPVKAIGNGYNVNAVAPRPSPKNERLQLVFVGSPGLPWHGVDRLEELAQLCPEFDFHLVGSSLDTQQENIVNHGYLAHAEVVSLYEKMDFGIGSLALYRNGMREGSPLKVREYLAYGLPVILSYDDVDLVGCPYVFKLPERGSLQSEVKGLKQFIEEWRGRSLPMEDVIQRIDFSVKEKNRLSFLQSMMIEEV